jgi:glycerol uptake facilitator-like aquaporin
LAAAFCTLLFGAGHGVHIPTGTLLQTVGTEFVLTFLLMLVIIAVATDNRVNNTVPAIAIGATVVLCVLIGGPVTGGSMNPARSLGPALFAGGPALANVWLYLSVPPLGAIAAAWLYEAIRIGHTHAVGAPRELLETLDPQSDTNGQR